GIRLNWNPLLPNPSLQNILVMRSEVYDSSYTLLKTLPVTDTTFTDKDVKAGRNYYYQMMVQGSQNYSLPTPRVSGIFLGKSFLLPAEDLVSEPTDEGIQLTWKYRDKEKLNGFNIYR